MAPTMLYKVDEDKDDDDGCVLATSAVTSFANDELNAALPDDKAAELTCETTIDANAFMEMAVDTFVAEDEIEEGRITV